MTVIGVVYSLHPFHLDYRAGNRKVTRITSTGNGLMKVFLLPANHHDWGDCDGYQVLIAAQSSRAARLAGRKYGFKFYRPYTDLPPDDDDIALALAHVGTLYWRPDDGTDFPWLPADTSSEPSR